MRPKSCPEGFTPQILVHMRRKKQSSVGFRVFGLGFRVFGLGAELGGCTEVLKVAGISLHIILCFRVTITRVRLVRVAQLQAYLGT